MSKVRASWIRNELKDRFNLKVDYKQIAKKCRELSVPFKEHGTMGIHFNSVLDQSDAERIVSAFSGKKGGSAPKSSGASSAPPKAQKQQTHKSSPPSQQSHSASSSSNRSKDHQHTSNRQNTPSNRGQGQQRPSNSGQQRSTGGQQRPSNSGQQRPSNSGQQRTTSGGQQRPSNSGQQRTSSSGGQQRTDGQRPAGAGQQRPGGGPQRPGGGNFRRRHTPNPKASKARQRRRRERKQQAQQAQLEAQVNPEDIIVELRPNMTVKDLADNMQISPGEIIKALFMKGMATTINHALELETAEMVAQELGYETIMPSESELKEEKKIVPSNVKKKIRAFEENEDPDKLKTRPPVITIMGHVDHGKTSLLDYIRNARVTEGEVGGITQKIGAYLVNVQDKPLVFIDTPGHEAFTSMRARGASITDIVIIVIAADDGIMPQTIEAINHAKASDVEIIVAVNKIDKPGADLDRAKQQLTEYNLVPEEWGGDTVIVPLSAKTGEGVDDLLEMLLLVSEVMELKANPKQPALGVVIESKLDKGRGSVGTVLIQTGTLKQGDSFVVGPVHGRVRAMVNERGKQLKQATPSIPVEIIGFQDVPNAGDILRVVKNDKKAKSLAAENREKMEEERLGRQRVNLTTFYENVKDGKMKELNIVLKADIQGSLDAIKQSLERLSGDQIQVKLIHAATGEVTENDIMLATASDALVLAFNVKTDNNGKRVAQREQIEIRDYDIIYKLIEDIELAMEGLLEPEMEEVEIGVAEVRAVFKISKSGTIAGSYMLEGRCDRNAKVRVRRDGEIVHTGKLSSLKRFKDDVKEVQAGYECGIAVNNYNDLAEGDRLEFFMVEAKQGAAKA